MITPRTSKAVVNVGELESKLKAGGEVTPEILAELGLVGKESGKIPPIKLLGSGALTKNLLVKDCQVSAGAKKKIEELKNDMYY